MLCRYSLTPAQPSVTKVSSAVQAFRSPAETQKGGVMKYYVNTNAQTNGDHEVHKDDPHCPTPASHQNRLYLGDFTNCADAVRVAKRHYSTANGCANCSSACHTT